jgi:c-di-GMP-binding flagellar brake protein YcgR
MNERSSLNKGGAGEEGFLVDISPGGMKVLLEDDVKSGTEISGQFRILPNAGPFYVKGVVTWVKPLKEKKGSANYEVGVKFLKINTIPF